MEETTPVPAIAIDFQRKIAELDERIALQKAEIDTMSHDIASSTSSTDLRTSALANIALPSNLQQILDSIKTIGAVTNETQDVQVCIFYNSIICKHLNYYRFPLKNLVQKEYKKCVV